MAASIHPGPQDALSATSGSAVQGQGQPGQPIRLRRAVYVHVSDLTSAYDIDHAKLEQELTRVRVEQEKQGGQDKPAETTGAGRPSPSDASDIDGATSSYPQKRLQPPRGGYNLCV